MELSRLCYTVLSSSGVFRRRGKVEDAGEEGGEMGPSASFGSALLADRWSYPGSFVDSLGYAVLMSSGVSHHRGKVEDAGADANMP